METAELLRRGVEAARAGRKPEARELLMQLVELDPRNEVAWGWLAVIMESLDDRIIACENVLTINPTNEKVRTYLSKLLKQKTTLAVSEPSQPVVPLPPQEDDPWGAKGPIIDVPDLAMVAQKMEEEGNFTEAVKAYELLAAHTTDSKSFDAIYKQITRLEALQKEKIHFVAPASSLNRLTWTWPLLYFSFALVQMGFNPFAHSRLYLWVALPIVVLGSFLLSLSEIRIRHVIWEKLFMEDGNGSDFARMVLAFTGWIFVLIPFGLMLFDSLGRLHHFKVPPAPF